MSKKPITELKFLCFGAGAIGTYIGGSLALSGQKVVFLERPEVAPLLKKNGLRISLKDKDYHLPEPDIVTSIDKALTHCPFDVAIFAVKSYDTAEILEGIASYNVALPPFLCLQNGVENEASIARIIGADKVIAGSVTTAIGKRGPGHIVVERLRGMGVAASHVLTPTLVAVLSEAGLRAQSYRKATSMKWSKMFTNLLANASSAILDMPPAEIFAHPGLFNLEIRQLRETLNVMAAQHIPVGDLPATPVRLLSFMVKSLPPRLSQPLLIRSLGKGRGGKMPSFHIDLYNGNPKSEVEYLNGAVVRYGEKMGVPTPVNRLLNQTLSFLVSGQLPKAEFAHQPQKLLNLLED